MVSRRRVMRRPQPDAEGREEDGDERAVELDGVLDDNETVFGVMEGGDEEAADETKDDDMALHDGVVKKYIRPGLRSGSAVAIAVQHPKIGLPRTHGVPVLVSHNS